MNNNFIPLSVPYLKGNEKKYLCDCIRTGWVSSGGPFVRRFEQTLAKYTGSNYAVAVSSGTAALHTALLTLGITEKDEVVVPTLTFIASVNVVRYVGAYPIFMDCDNFLNIDVNKIKEFCLKECTFNGKNLTNKRTGRKLKAIIAVHVLGYPVDIEPLMALSKKFKFFVIEDAAEAIGSYYTSGKYKGRKTGTIGHIGCYSFNGNKIITTGGGGAIITSRKKWADKARYLANQAKDNSLYFLHNNIGYNYRMNNLEAAVGIAQIEKLDKFIRIKRRNFMYYKKKLERVLGLSLLSEPPNAFSNYWNYPLLLSRAMSSLRQRILDVSAKNNVECRPLWRLNHGQKPYLKTQRYRIKKAPDFYRRIVNLPCSVGIKRKEIDKVIKIISKIVFDFKAAQKKGRKVKYSAKKNA